MCERFQRGGFQGNHLGIWFGRIEIVQQSMLKSYLNESLFNA